MTDKIEKSLFLLQEARDRHFMNLMQLCNDLIKDYKEVEHASVANVLTSTLSITIKGKSYRLDITSEEEARERVERIINIYS
jgi:hypothetical protein